MNNEYELKLERTENKELQNITKNNHSYEEEKFIQRKRKCKTPKVKLKLIFVENFRILKLIRIMKTNIQNFV